MNQGPLDLQSNALPAELLQPCPSSPCPCATRARPQADTQEESSSGRFPGKSRAQPWAEGTWPLPVSKARWAPGLVEASLHWCVPRCAWALYKRDSGKDMWADQACAVAKAEDGRSVGLVEIRKTLSPCPWKASPHPFLPCSTSLLSSQLFYFLPPEQCRGWGMEGCGQSIPVPLCCSFLRTLFPCSPSYELQSFDINLLQHGSPQATILSGIIQHLQCWVVHRLQGLPSPLWSSPWAAGDHLLWHVEHFLSILLH